MFERPETIQVSTTLSNEALVAICEAADVIGCECPSYLVRLLQEVREFRRYTSECCDRFPEDQETHGWLSDQATQVESLLSQTIFELFQREDLLDQNNQLDLSQLSERSRQRILDNRGS